MSSVKYCHMMGCFNHVEVKFSRALKRENEYSLVVVGDTRERCQFSVPEVRSTVACSDNLELRFSSHRQVEGFVYFGHPARLSISLASTTSEHRETIGPFKWQKLLPNGPNCEPTCLVSSHEVALPIGW